MSDYKYILFDLDGTLTDSAEGIVNSVIHALEKKAIPVPEREALLPFVGPPLVDSFMKYFHMTKEEAEVSVEDYREYFREKGWCENLVYEGIPQVLEQLKDQGKHLIVATSKPEVFSRRIVAHFGLESYFDFVVGSSLDGTITTKGQVINCVLETVGREHREEMVMVGDREHDVLGAKEHGLPCVGVLYGYGSRQELEQAGAASICQKPLDLPECISGME